MEKISRSKKFLKKLREGQQSSSSNWTSEDQKRYNDRLKRAKRQNNLKLIRSEISARNIVLNH